jgi:hypothetical protein
MVKLVSIADKAVITDFIRHIRNNLWLVSLRQQLLFCFRISAVLLLLSGIWNLFLCSVPLALTLSAALLPLGYAFYKTYQLKPSLAAAARHADQLFQGKSLMTTALDLLYQTETASNEYCNWVIAQAVQKEKHWREEFIHITKPQTQATPWFTLLIALLGIFLILHPAQSNKFQVAEDQTNPHSAEIKTSQPAAVDSLLDTIRKEQSATNNNAEISAADTKDQLENYPIEQPAANPQQHPKNSTDVHNDPKEHQVTTTVPTQEAGSSNAQNPTTKNQPVTKELTVKWVNMDLEYGDAANSAEKGLQFKEAPKTQKTTVNLPAPTIVKTANSAYATELSIIQQQFVATYFTQLKLK